jgi:hypothetical protein
MIDLSPFPVGTVVLFQGPLTDPIDLGIDIATKSRWTHAAVVRYPGYIVECTRPLPLIEHGFDGVQESSLADKLVGLESGTSAAAFIPNDAMPDEYGFASFIDHCLNLHIKYGVDELFKFLFHVEQRPSDDALEMVCSTFVAGALVNGRLLPWTLNWAEVTPVMLAGLLCEIGCKIVPILRNPDLKGLPCAS